MYIIIVKELTTLQLKCHPFWDLTILQNLMVQQSPAGGEISPDGQNGK